MVPSTRPAYHERFARDDVAFDADGFPDACGHVSLELEMADASG
jgi:hypothetical protein